MPTSSETSTGCASAEPERVGGAYAYFAVVEQAAERNYESRVRTLGTTPRVPIEVMAQAAAGVHLALLESWLAGKLDYPLEELVGMQLNLLVAGIAWGQGMSVEEFELPPTPGERPAVT